MGDTEKEQKRDDLHCTIWRKSFLKKSKLRLNSVLFSPKSHRSFVIFKIVLK